MLSPGCGATRRASNWAHLRFRGLRYEVLRFASAQWLQQVSKVLVEGQDSLALRRVRGSPRGVPLVKAERIISSPRP